MRSYVLTTIVKVYTSLPGYSEYVSGLSARRQCQHSAVAGGTPVTTVLDAAPCHIIAASHTVPEFYLLPQHATVNNNTYSAPY